MEIDEEKVYEEFEKALAEAIAIYQDVKNISYPQLNIFIEERVWDATLKYDRMERVTKEKFFESLYKRTSLDEYTKAIYELWGNVDHTYMDKSIKELQKMVIQKDFRDAEMYGDKKITQRSIKLQNTWEEYITGDYELYKLNPERDFRTMEKRYMDRHIKLYKNMLKRYKDAPAEEIAKFVKTYDKLDKQIPYFAHKDKYINGNIIYKKGDIIRYVDIQTYNSMLYNVNLTRSAWNRAIYDAKLLGNHLWYLPAHSYACPGCAFYQGYVYTDHEPNLREMNVLIQYGKSGFYYKEDALEDKANIGIPVGHPNCKHVWVSYWSDEQIQEEKYNSEEWKEKYETQQKIQSLDLKKSRLLSDRRIYKELGQQDLVDKTTAQIKAIREKKKELE